MLFRLLGPLEIHGGAQHRPIQGSKRQALLAALLLHAGHEVSTSRVVDALWGDSPPASAAANIRTYVADLRRSLSGLDGADVRVVSGVAGYLIDVDPEELDIAVFGRLADAGERASEHGDQATAAVLLERATRLWRGRPLGDLELGSWAGAARVALEDRYWEAQACLVDTRLELGRVDGGLIAALREMVAERPLCERTWAQLMVALDRSGRKSEALAVFSQAREILSGELGLEPGAELRDVQHRILQGGRRPARAGLSRPEVAVASVRPRGLPAPPRLFLGRGTELRRVRAAVADSAVVAVCGPPGSGKTALLLRAADELAPEFRDGQLHHGLVDRTQTGDVLGEFLCSLGVPRGDLPDTVEDRALDYRAMLADRRVLVVLDDVVEMDAVTPLLPGSGPARVLVAARCAPTALDPAAAIRLGQLPGADMVALLESLAGPDRVRAEYPAARRIVRCCDGSPLALRIAAARLAVRPDLRLATLAARLADPAGRLDELSMAGRSVRGSLTASYRRLSGPARAVLHAAAAVDPGELTVPVLAERVGITEAKADRAVEELVIMSLLDCPRPGDVLHRIADLVRLFARELADSAGPPCVAPGPSVLSGPIGVVRDA